MRRARTPISILAAAAVVAAAPAAAHWAGAGVGAGSARTATPIPVIISAGSASAPLYPTGLATGDVAVTLANANPFPVRVAQLALDTSRGNGGLAVDAAHDDCPVAALAFTTQTNGGAGWSVPAGGSLALDLTRSITMAATAPAACQGASFTVYLTS